MQNQPVCKTDVVTEAPTRASTYCFVTQRRNFFVLQNTVSKILIASTVGQKFPSKLVRKWGISSKLYIKSLSLAK